MPSRHAPGQREELHLLRLRKGIPAARTGAGAQYASTDREAEMLSNI
jgi:hypothetical protein